LLTETGEAVSGTCFMQTSIFIVTPREVYQLIANS
jgi:hypothetical protein